MKNLCSCKIVLKQNKTGELFSIFNSKLGLFKYDYAAITP